MRLPVVFFLSFFLDLAILPWVNNQAASAVPGKTDNIAYRILFQRTLLYRSHLGRGRLGPKAQALSQANLGQSLCAKRR